MIVSSLLGTVGLARDPANVAVARRWVDDLLGAEHPALYGVQQCLTELITNSFQHTDSQAVSVFVSRAGAAIRGEVVDGGAAEKWPHLRGTPDSDEYEGGRGLHVVHALTAGRWGSRVDGRGRRTTWFEVAAGGP